jgi:arginase
MHGVEVIGVPTDYGTNRRGVDMGPSAIRYAGLGEELTRAGVDCTDGGDLPVPRVEERSGGGTPDARFLPAVREVTEDLADRVAGTLREGRVPLVLGGDHSIAIGSLRGVARDDPVGVLWFDAHGDFNTPETTPSGNVHGMGLAAALGVGAFADAEWAHAAGLREENVVWVGLRDLDDAERAAVRESEATAFTMSDVDEAGIHDVVERALDVATDGVAGVHVSFDLDVIDPTEAPGVGTPVRGGATYREAHTAMEAVAGREAVRSLELVEVNPILDERNATAALAVELAASALGKRVL